MPASPRSRTARASSRRIKDPAGRLTTFTFSGNNLQAVQQADSSRVTYTYDGSGRMTQVKDQRVQSDVGRLRQRRARGYDHAGRSARRSSSRRTRSRAGPTAAPRAARPRRTLLAESATTYTDPNGNAYQMRPDWWGLGQLGQATDPYGNVSANDLNANGLPNVSIDALERITQYNYDSLGNPTKITYPDLTNDQYTYNSYSEPLTHTDGNGHTTSYTYERNGKPHGNQGRAQQPHDADLHGQRPGSIGDGCQ